MTIDNAMTKDAQSQPSSCRPRTMSGYRCLHMRLGSACRNSPTNWPTRSDARTCS